MLLFNKNKKGADELKSLIGFLYKSNSFENIATDIELAQEDIALLIGDDVLARAVTHYHSDAYKCAAPSSTAIFNDKLVKHIQLPVALLAYKSYSENADVSHEDDGRKVKINAENEKLPWEWMLDRDNAAMLKKAYKTLDRLIIFIEKNASQINEWQKSEVRQLKNSLFISQTTVFDDIYPIDNSLRFFLKLLPFMREVERKQIKPVLGKLFLTLKRKKELDKLEASDKELLAYIQSAIPFFTMSIAIRRLSLQVIPEGVVQSFVSERLTSQAKSVPDKDWVNKVATSLQADGESELRALENYLSKHYTSENSKADSSPLLPKNNVTHKYFTV